MRINERERESVSEREGVREREGTDHFGSFHTVKPSEASAGDYWLMGRCERCVIINIWDSRHGGTLMTLLA